MQASAVTSKLSRSSEGFAASQYATAMNLNGS